MRRENSAFAQERHTSFISIHKYFMRNFPCCFFVHKRDGRYWAGGRANSRFNLNKSLLLPNDCDETYLKWKLFCSFYHHCSNWWARRIHSSFVDKRPFHSHFILFSVTVNEIVVVPLFNYTSYRPTHATYFFFSIELRDLISFHELEYFQRERFLFGRISGVLRGGLSVVKGGNSLSWTVIVTCRKIIKQILARRQKIEI